MHLIEKRLGYVVRGLEISLAIMVIFGVIAAAIGSFQELIQLNWKLEKSFDELIHRVLLVVIGLELVRMLVVHSLSAVLNLLAFVIARKLLKPNIESTDLIMSVAAFVALMAAHRYLLVRHLAPVTGEERAKDDDAEDEE